LFGEELFGKELLREELSSGRIVWGTIHRKELLIYVGGSKEYTLNDFKTV
jgi:hypothetical protein